MNQLTRWTPWSPQLWLHLSTPENSKWKLVGHNIYSNMESAVSDYSINYCFDALSNWLLHSMLLCVTPKHHLKLLFPSYKFKEWIIVTRSTQSWEPQDDFHSAHEAWKWGQCQQRLETSAFLV
jgi:hypothetical protein